MTNYFKKIQGFHEWKKLNDFIMQMRNDFLN